MRKNINPEGKRVSDLIRKVKKKLPNDIQVEAAHIYELLENGKKIDSDIDWDNVILMCRSIQQAFLSHLKRKAELPEIIYNSDKASCKKMTNIYTLNYDIKDRLYKNYGELTLDVQEKISQLDREVYLCFQIVPFNTCDGALGGFFAINITASIDVDEVFLRNISNEISSHYKEVIMDCDYYKIIAGMINQDYTLYEEDGLSLTTITIGYNAIPNNKD